MMQRYPVCSFLLDGLKRESELFRLADNGKMVHVLLISPWAMIRHRA